MAEPSKIEIPWDLLVSNFTFVPSHPDHNHVTDFYPRKEPNQGSDLNRFVEVLSKTLAESAARERKKYPERYKPAPSSKIVISDADALKIAPYLRGHHAQCDMDERYETRKEDLSVALCTHVGDTTCRCALRYEERRMATFLHHYTTTDDCYEFDLHNHESFLGLEIFKALLIYGSMDAVLRICAHPAVDLLTWWSVRECECEAPSLGWDMLCRQALRNYIGLKFSQNFAERCAQEYPGEDPEDVRRTGMYQKMVRNSTMSDMKSEVLYYRYRNFYGIMDGQFQSYPKPRHLERWCGTEGRFDYGSVLGRVSYDEFLVVEKVVPYVPSAEDIDEARAVLTDQRLPVELADMILDFAGYNETRTLTVRHEPLHERNRGQLKCFLEECWQVLLRCDMMGRALGEEVPWDMVIGNCMAVMFYQSPWQTGFGYSWRNGSTSRNMLRQVEYSGTGFH